MKIKLMKDALNSTFYRLRILLSSLMNRPKSPTHQEPLKDPALRMQIRQWRKDNLPSLAVIAKLGLDMHGTRH